jgi:hypothetical protein
MIPPLDQTVPTSVADLFTITPSLNLQTQRPNFFDPTQESPSFLLTIIDANNQKYRPYPSILNRIEELNFKTPISMVIIDNLPRKSHPRYNSFLSPMISQPPFFRFSLFQQLPILGPSNRTIYAPSFTSNTILLNIPQIPHRHTSTKITSHHINITKRHTQGRLNELLNHLQFIISSKSDDLLIVSGSFKFPSPNSHLETSLSPTLLKIYRWFLRLLQGRPNISLLSSLTHDLTFPATLEYIQKAFCSPSFILTCPPIPTNYIYPWTIHRIPHPIFDPMNPPNPISTSYEDLQISFLLPSIHTRI